MATEDKSISINFTLDKDRVVVLRSAFPDNDDIQQVANTIAQLITNELIDLLAGEKRYLSLSHQYIEWVQRIYEELLPNEEYTYERLYNKFNFPPGTAAYMARVLRARQNTTLRIRALKELKEKLSRESQIYKALKPDQQINQSTRNIKITARAYDLLGMAVDRLIAKGTPIEPPTTTSRSKEYVAFSYSVQYIERILVEIDNINM